VQGYTRRQLKEDKFAATTKDAVQWTSGHRKSVIGGFVLAALLIGAIIGSMIWLDRQNKAANEGLGSAIRTLNAPLRSADAPAGVDTSSFTTATDRAKAAAKQFKDVADKYKITKAGKLARYLEGMASMQAGDNAAAEQQLKAVAGSGEKDIAALAKAALASLYRSTNRQADAAKIYKDLQDHPTDTVSKAQAQLDMAEMYEASDPQAAAGIYQQIQKENPDSFAGQVAASKLGNAK
jgi:Tetratricopeptide repeat-like domain